jgi:hypothetical protein
MSDPIRNRIVRHARVRAGDLVPHEMNPRRHPHAQREALEALYREVGFARSLLAYALPDGRLKLIDGHLRQKLDPDMEVEVEVLDVSEDEARKLLLSIDPLASLAENDPARLDDLRALAQTDSDALANLWRSIGEAGAEAEEKLQRAQREPGAPPEVRERYFVLVECAGEEEQLALLERFGREGLRCRRC